MTNDKPATDVHGARFEEEFLTGKRLYGDDFHGAAIEDWYREEKEGYADLDGGPRSADQYGYHALNLHHGFRHLPSGMLGDALGFGSAHGGEFSPLESRLDSITIVEPSEQLRSSQIGRHRPTYVNPSLDSKLPFLDDSFDLITCLGVLHHIPNVSSTLTELSRVLRPGGWMLLREPIHSMGDWRQRRPGLTARERGIPLPLLNKVIDDAQLSVAHTGLCVFSLTARAARIVGNHSPWNSRTWVYIDAILARRSSPLYRYHATSTWQKVRPTAAYFVLRSSL